MVMVDAVSNQPTGGPMARVRRLDPKVGSRLALFCIHRVNKMNSRNDGVKAGCVHLCRVAGNTV